MGIIRFIGWVFLVGLALIGFVALLTVVGAWKLIT